MLGEELAKNTTFLMGFSFMLGSLFTIFVLLILEMLRASREARERALWEAEHDNIDREMSADAQDRAA